MSIANPYQKYQQNAILSANPGQLLLMLYNGISRYLRLAVIAIEEKDLESAHNHIIKVQNIILHLQETLDFRYEIAKSLNDLYNYIYRQTIEANIKKDPAIFEPLINMIEELRDAWVEAIKLAER